MKKLDLRHKRLLVQLCVLLAAFDCALAAEGEPLAVRRWKDGTVSVENHWGLNVVVNATNTSSAQFSRPVDKSIQSVDAFNHILSRPANHAQTQWMVATEVVKPDKNGIRISTVDSDIDFKLLRLDVDGVTILFASKEQVADGRFQTGELLEDIDLLILTFADENQLLQVGVTQFIEKISPNRILLNPISDQNPSDLSQFLSAITTEEPAQKLDHNTLAVSTTTTKSASPTVVALTSNPWKMDGKLATLFSAMESSCRDSQKVFKKLSVNQLNFTPSNGTHTPRWNVEHMMGRQLLFFSQIYTTQDASVVVMNLNPKQMPPDYVFAHPDWDGMEEARQMQRVSDFCRRFAYLLDGMDVDKKAPGSNWPSLRALLVQMYRHYTEHTANTVKKFELTDWPSK